MRKSEYVHLVNDYLIPQHKYYHSRLSPSAEAEIRIMLRSLKPFERPDMYAKIGNKVYAVEHFSFDASSENRKGMEGIREENLLERRLSTAVTAEEGVYDKGNYSVTIANLQKNFEKHFYDHYDKIGSYKDHLYKAGILYEADELIVGFFAENLYPPYYNKGNRYEGELYYSLTKQFADLLLRSPNVQFMLFGSYVDGQLKLAYVDQEHLPPENLRIDIESPELSLSSINQNEITWNCTLEE